jgi:hypothetical protein
MVTTRTKFHRSEIKIDAATQWFNASATTFLQLAAAGTANAVRDSTTDLTTTPERDLCRRNIQTIKEPRRGTRRGEL